MMRTISPLMRFGEMPSCLEGRYSLVTMKWMVFTMLSLKSVPDIQAISRKLLAALGLLVLLLWQLPAMAKVGVLIQPASLKATDHKQRLYQLNATISYQLTPYLEQALLNGVLLKSSLQIGLSRHRSWWWNESRLLHAINFQLQYHALSRHFLLTRLDTGERWNYRVMAAALRKMGDVKDFRLSQLPEAIAAGDHFVFVSARLSPATLRLPLRIQSLFSDQYSIRSGVRSWPLP